MPDCYERALSESGGGFSRHTFSCGRAVFKFYWQGGAIVAVEARFGAYHYRAWEVDEAHLKPLSIWMAEIKAQIRARRWAGI